MKKKIWIGIAILFGLFILFEVYQFATTRSHSPELTETFKSNNVEISVTYCRPYKKGRLIFGPENEDALVPYGKYWRLGANDATEITFSEDIMFGHESVKAGSYRMYAVPNADAWEVSLNSELGEFGYFEPDYNLDVAKIKASVEEKPDITEQFTIKFEEHQDKVMMYFLWDQTKVEIPITYN